MAGALVGVWLTGLRQRARAAVPFSAGVLLGVAIFGLLPEMTAEIGWRGALGLFLAGYLVLFAINRWAYPVCPTCSHDHDHKACSTLLHGFAGPLVAASVVHSFLDGWSIGSAQQGALPLGIRVAVPLAISLHKIPEGIALGAILRAAVGSRTAALGWCAVSESPTVAGGAVALALAPFLGTTWITYPLAIAGGCFLYLGFHAVHEEWKRRGPAPAFTPALTGIAAVALIEHTLRAFFH